MSYMRRERGAENEQRRSTRPGTRRQMMDGGRNKIAQESFTRDAGKLWNNGPKQINRHSDCNDINFDI